LQVIKKRVEDSNNKETNDTNRLRRLKPRRRKGTGYTNNEKEIKNNSADMPTLSLGWQTLQPNNSI